MADNSQEEMRARLEDESKKRKAAEAQIEVLREANEEKERELRQAKERADYQTERADYQTERAERAERRESTYQESLYRTKRELSIVLMRVALESMSNRTNSGIDEIIRTSGRIEPVESVLIGLPVPDGLVERAWHKWISLNLKPPDDASPECGLQNPSSVHFYLSAMFNVIFEAKRDICGESSSGEAVELDHERPLLPRKFRPDYVLRLTADVSFSVFDALLMIEAKRNIRPSSHSAKQMRAEALRDAVGYGCARLSDLLSSNQLTSFSLTLGITPLDVVFVRALVVDPGMEESSSSAAAAAAYTERHLPRLQLSYTQPLLIEGPSSSPGPGFQNIVRCLCASPLSLGYDKDLPLQSIDIGSRHITLGPRLGQGSSASVYRVELSEDELIAMRQSTKLVTTSSSASSVSAAASSASSASAASSQLSREGAPSCVESEGTAASVPRRLFALKLLHAGSTCRLSKEAEVMAAVCRTGAVNLPSVLASTERFILLEPCGMPLVHVSEMLYRRHPKRHGDEDISEVLCRAIPGQKALGFMAFRGVLGALSASHEAGHVHCDIRPVNVVLVPSDGPHHKSHVTSYASSVLID